MQYFPVTTPFMVLLFAVLTALVVLLQIGVLSIAGSMGCLLGADVLNLHRIRELGAPVASIGGAGISDGVFLTGIIAVLLA